MKTLRTPLDGSHPLAGNRAWGIQADPNGGFTFYTTAVDRIYGVIETVLNTWAERAGAKSGFDQADLLWKSLQQKMIQFINNNGGSAGLYDPATPGYVQRPNWADVDLYLRDEIDLNELLRRIGC